MTLVLKGLPQVSQDGKYLWFTDKTGEYNVDSNAGGWGSPNFELNQSAILQFTYRKATNRELVAPVGNTVKHSAAATNADELVFQMDYLNDGWHQFYSFRLMVSTDDVNSIDTAPIVFAEGDIWYNSNDTLVKQMVGGSPTTLDLTDINVLDTIIGNTSVVELLCEQIYWKNLSQEKNERYTKQREARRRSDSSQEDRMRRDQMDIMLGTASSAYQFNFGLKTAAQDEIETLLDEFNLN